jgi:hypothetical protein
MVNELILSDVAVGLDATGEPGMGQQQLNNALTEANALGNFTLSTCFFSDELSNCGNVNVFSTPEPGTLVYLCLGSIAIFLAAFCRHLRHRRLQ